MSPRTQSRHVRHVRQQPSQFDLTVQQETLPTNHDAAEKRQYEKQKPQISMVHGAQPGMNEKFRAMKKGDIPAS